MTAQEIFDKVVAHLRSQGCKSQESAGGMCVYRGPNGTKCAAGCLIEDKYYRRAFEGNTFEHIILSSNALSAQFSTHVELIQALQNAHDMNPVKAWESVFAQISRDCGLVYTPPAVP